METVITLADTPDNLRDQVVRAIKSGYRPADTEIYTSLFKRRVARPSECRFDKDDLVAELAASTSMPLHADDHAAARQAIEFLETRLPRRFR